MAPMLNAVRGVPPTFTPLIYALSFIMVSSLSLMRKALASPVYSAFPIEANAFIDSDGVNFITSQGEILVALNSIPAAQNRWDRTAMVAAREAMEEFLTNKSPKILKDWNGNIWLVMFTSEIDLTFVNEWGMGIASFSATWTEVGNAEDQYDLQNSGLINIGGV